MIYLRLFWEFFKTGLFAVGGGMATIPFLSDIADKTGWFTHAQLADMIAVADSTPGPLGVNTATYVGFTAAGPLGSLVATFGLVLPSVIIVLLIAKVLDKFRTNFFVNSAFYALRPASSGLIAAAGCTVLTMSVLHLDLFKETGAFADLFDLKCLILLVLLAVLTNLKKLKKLHPIVFIAFAAVFGIVFKLGV